MPCLIDFMGRLLKLNPQILETGADYSISELAKLYDTSDAVIAGWLSRLKNKKIPGYRVERIRTDDRFIIRKAKK